MEEFEKWVRNSKFRKLYAFSEGLACGGASLFAAGVVYRWLFALALGSTFIFTSFCVFKFLLGKYRKHLTRKIWKRLGLEERK